MMTDLGLSRLLQLCSPALPVGAYAYSSGLEAAVEEGRVTSVAEAREWITGVFSMGLGELDLPALLIAYDSLRRGRPEMLARIDDYLQASRETSELLLEDRQMGQSLHRLEVSLGMDPPQRDQPSFVTAFAVAGVHWQISRQNLAVGFSFSWLENQVGVATKTVPFGQTDAQQLLATLSLLVSDAVNLADCRVAAQIDIENIDDWDLGQSLPGVAILSSRHEQQPSRLYRS